uniref:Uncharacterized protein n=1 Tax=Rhizophora mucronata TaxID=61149 RepID=A0A2P2QIY0_RHIMU
MLSFHLYCALETFNCIKPLLTNDFPKLKF